MGFPTWQGATHCTGSATLGGQALMRFIIESYGSKGAQNWGIYNCRDVVGGATTSCHGEGRALDVGFPLGDPDGDELLRRLLRVPGRLGIQAIIYERRIYSQLSPQGRPYTGEAPHFDHIHIELTREAAQKLTYETVRRTLHRQAPPRGQPDVEEGRQRRRRPLVARKAEGRGRRRVRTGDGGGSRRVREGRKGTIQGETRHQGRWRCGQEQLEGHGSQAHVLTATTSVTLLGTGEPKAR